MQEPDIVYSILEQMLDASPEASYKRLNPALRSTLQNCIEADLPFQKDTFERIYSGLRGGWWFGDGAGSSMGEHYYSLACRVNHSSAQQSFEQFAERPGVLWEEDSKAPERLHVGSQITWKGVCLTVTSMRKDSLVACSYKDVERDHDRLKPGSFIGYSERIITSAKRDGKATIIRVIDAPRSNGDRVLAKRLTIKYSEIAELRKTCRARVKAMVEKIAACNPDKDRARLTKEINAEHFRHFELEEIQAAFSKRVKWLASEVTVEAWRNGTGGAWLDSHDTLIRLRADRVECSNGNSISKAAAKAVLPVLLDNRKKTVDLDVRVDSYTIDRVSKDGVKIGCTRVPWPEVERIIPQLQ